MISTEVKKPDEDDVIEMDADPGIISGGNGPASDESLGGQIGPAGGAA